MASTSNPDAIGEAGEERNEAAAAAAEAGVGSQLVMPEDGYQWKKYGQKFIKNIQKMRSYFRCRHKLCGAKKKVEWHPIDAAGGEVRVVYEGAHRHGSPPSSAASGGQQGGANQYELGAQYFGGGGARSH